MTANQIRAAEVFEKKRSNLVNESLGRDTLTETGRHNRAVEDESRRHNYQSESIDRSRNTETVRHNLASEGLGYQQLSEQNRHNKNAEAASYMQAGSGIIGSIAKVIDAIIPL